MERRTRIQRWWSTAGTLAVSLIVTSAASAAYPGEDGRILFSAGGDVWSINPDGSGLSDLTDVPGGPGEGRDPSVSASGLVAFVVGTGSASEIWTMAADGSGAHAVTSNGATDQMPSISADGTRIAFITDRDGGDGDVWTMAGDGGAASPLYVAAGDDEYPQFSRDGDQVVFATHLTGDLDLARMPSSGGPYSPVTVTQLTERSTLAETTPAIEPDQVRLAYSQYDPLGLPPQQRNIYTAYSNDGTDEFPLATTGVSETTPAFSPEGTRVVYVTPQGLVLADAGGANPAPLPNGSAGAPSDPDWAVAPDSRAPATAITKKPRRRTSKRTVRLRFQSSETGSSFQCRLDRADFTPCTSPAIYKHLKRGRHRFRVAAVDAAGNADPSPAVARFRVVRPSSPGRSRPRPGSPGRRSRPGS